MSPLDVLDDRACRVCGCTEERACPGRCWWIEWDLCSTCDAVEQTRAFRLQLAGRLLFLACVIAGCLSAWALIITFGKRILLNVA